MMKKIALLIDYDGTEYAGWQRQENAIGIQELVEDAVSKVTGERIILKAAGRTDAGVHAKGQVADFETNSTIPGDRFLYAINNLLPDDIRIMKSCEVESDFSSRFDAISKHYRYQIYNARVIPGTIQRYTAHYKKRLDVELMQRAGNVMVGEHDFKAFEGPFAQMQTSVRRVLDVRVTRDDDIVTVDVVGEAFLKNMIRIMVGAMIKVSEHRMTIDELEQILREPGNKKAGVTMPAKGLTMMSISYDKEKLSW